MYILGQYLWLKLERVTELCTQVIEESHTAGLRLYPMICSGIFANNAMLQLYYNTVLLDAFDII
jgi:hypothetical protein